MSRALIVLQNEHDRDRAARWAKGVPLGSRIEFKETKRSLPQNDLMWALLTEVAQQLDHGGRKYDATEWKSIFLHGFGREISFLPSLDMKTFLPIELSSSDLSKGEMTDFIEYILKEGTERGVTFHDPNNSPSDATPSPASENGDAASPPEASSKPEDSAPSESSGSHFGWNYEGDDLKHIREFAEKGIREYRRAGEVAASVLIEAMHPQYMGLLKTADAVTALESIKRALELVLKGDRNVDRVEAWIGTEFFQEA